MKPVAADQQQRCEATMLMHIGGHETNRDRSRSFFSVGHGLPLEDRTPRACFFRRVRSRLEMTVEMSVEKEEGVLVHHHVETSQSYISILFSSWTLFYSCFLLGMPLFSDLNFIPAH